MKHELICQIWKSRKGFEYVADSYSLHLTEQSRLHFLCNSTIPSNIVLVDFYKCRVPDELHEKVLRNQAKHGMMFTGFPPTRVILGDENGQQEFLKAWSDLSHWIVNS